MKKVPKYEFSVSMDGIESKKLIVDCDNTIYQLMGLLINMFDVYEKHNYKMFYHCDKPLDDSNDDNEFLSMIMDHSNGVEYVFKKQNFKYKGNQIILDGNERIGNPEKIKLSDLDLENNSKMNLMDDDLNNSFQIEIRYESEIF